MLEEQLQRQCIGFLKTPPLWQNKQFNITQFVFPKINVESFIPKPIPNNIRLGHQMEYVFRQLIEHSEAYRILLYNLPIKDGKRTMGEIDFILEKIDSQEPIHIELTYKFYIINTKISEPVHQLMGPNKRDMFFTKMEKIKNEQFGLLHSPQGIQALYDKGIDHAKINHQVCYKAQLFMPYGTETAHIRPLEKDCITGYWLKFDDFDSREFKGLQFYIPFKSEWVVIPHGQVLWKSHFETLLEINLRMLKENAPMVWMKKENGEIEKIFVVWW
ncbi:DUF1853 family protein [Costertonia aggregata]|uniref:DUF1853 family protein n=1 Tax=Costertonia aggregata TaxID=343403 RepID=A0A7H9AV50_9FLAO|nr:DUF1853 family protein [Costertonia aggregata]QLG47045.1 DUF1853 family protein [Costertonia aggregata]